MVPLLLAAQADAYTLRTTEDGELVRWDRFPVGYAWIEQDLDPPGSAEAVHGSFEAWAGTGTPIAFQQDPTPGLAPRGVPDDDNLVAFVPDWPFDADVLASTESWSTVDGELLAFDIRVNPYVPWATDGDPRAFDLRAAVTHEVGHALGLDHSEVDEATMFAVQRPGEAFRGELSDDDVAAVRELYLGDEALLVGCSSVPGPGPTLAGLVVLSLVRRRR